MNLKRIEDKKPKMNWKGALTGGLTEGKPTQDQLNDFAQVVEGQAPMYMSEGQVKIKGNICLAMKMTPPREITIPSCQESLEMIGTKIENDACIVYFRPRSGWKNANQAKEL